MKLLLVDDEEYVIDSIKRNLDLEEAGVDEVYTAYSVQQAKNIMEMVNIDIVISDIVMPGGTGFEFVEWVRRQKLKVQVIFLTSYAEFDYARRAIQLNSVEYLLKPIDFEKLKQAVCQAAEVVIKEKEMRDLRQESIKWGRNKKILQKDIWKTVLKYGFSEEKFCETALQRQLHYEPGHYFRLICLTPEGKIRKREEWDVETMEFVIENVMSELYEGTEIIVDTVFYQEPGIYWIVMQSSKKEYPQEDASDKEILQQYVKWMNEKICSEFWCGVGCWESVLKIQKQSQIIQKMYESSLSVRNEVLFLSEFQTPETIYENKELDIWKILLYEEKTDELLKRIRKYLDRTKQGGMITRIFLSALRTDLVQMVYAWLSEREIKANALFSDAEMEKLQRDALSGRDQMIEYAKMLVQKAIQYKQYINKSDSVMSQVCAYIDAHYREEIHREELGELVFLNTDYLSRIFKKEKGISISTYIIQKRVEAAKKLLTQSTLPINTVSLYVGYSNFSYFTKMFKENTGYAPLEYRRNFSEK